MNLHNQIMNIQAKPADVNGTNYALSYKEGHRDARHAAAELALQADAEIERLQTRLTDSALHHLTRDAQDDEEIKRLRAAIEDIAKQWDGCTYDAPGGDIDIGAAIRAEMKRICP